MDLRVVIEIVIGLILAIAGWSLRLNFASVSKKIDEVAKDMRAMAAVAAAHTARIAVLDQRVTTLEQRALGLEERERRQHVSGPARVPGDLG